MFVADTDSRYRCRRTQTCSPLDVLLANRSSCQDRAAKLDKQWQIKRAAITGGCGMQDSAAPCWLGECSRNGQVRFRGCLMLGPNALHFKGLGKLIQAAVEVCAKLHQVFNVIDDWKVDLCRQEVFFPGCKF